MDITIGIAENGRQLTVSVDQTPEAVESLVDAALAGEMLRLTDDKGRRVLVPTSKIAFVEIGPADSRRVGFTAAGS